MCNKPLKSPIQNDIKIGLFDRTYHSWNILWIFVNPSLKEFSTTILHSTAILVRSLATLLYSYSIWYRTLHKIDYQNVLYQKMLCKVAIPTLPPAMASSGLGANKCWAEDGLSYDGSPDVLSFRYISCIVLMSKIKALYCKD